MISVICVVIIGTTGGVATFFVTKKASEKRTEISKVKRDRTKKADQTTVKENMKKLEKIREIKMLMTLNANMKYLEDLIEQNKKTSVSATENKTKPGKN